MTLACRCAAALIGCVATTSTLAFAAAHEAAPLELMGVHIGQTEEQARHALTGHASFDKEVENQQIWRVLQDPSMQYIFIGFDHERRVRYVTTVAASSGPPMACAPLGDPATAVKKGDAPFVEFRREVKQEDETLAIIAKGPSAEHLSRCSIKKVGGGEEEEEEEQRERSKQR